MRKRRKYRKEFSSFDPETSFFSESLFFWVAVAVTLGAIVLIYGILK